MAEGKRLRAGEQSTRGSHGRLSAIRYGADVSQRPARVPRSRTGSCRMSNGRSWRHSKCATPSVLSKPPRTTDENGPI